MLVLVIKDQSDSAVADLILIMACSFCRMKSAKLTYGAGSRLFDKKPPVKLVVLRKDQSPKKYTNRTIERQFCS